MDSSQCENADASVGIFFLLESAEMVEMEKYRASNLLNTARIAFVRRRIHSAMEELDIGNAVTIKGIIRLELIDAFVARYRTVYLMQLFFLVCRRKFEAVA